MICCLTIVDLIAKIGGGLLFPVKALPFADKLRPQVPRPQAEDHLYRLIVIGASAGGVTAVRALLAGLRAGFDLPVVIVQHMPATARLDVDLIYGAGAGNKAFKGVIEVEDKMRLRPGFVYMAAPGYHVLVERDGSLALSEDEPVKHSRPSIDVLFESAALAYRDGVVGLILTGANSDGAEGLRRIHEAGGLTLVQDPDSAEVPYMPQAALELFRPDLIADLEGLAACLNGLHKRPRPRAGDWGDGSGDRP